MINDTRVQDKSVQAGRNKKELGIYLDRSIISLLEIKKDQPIVLTADKKKKQIIIQF